MSRIGLKPIDLPTGIEVKVDDNNQLRDISFDPVNPNYIGGDYYDGENGDGWHPKLWKIYKVGHKHFANKTMAFENKTSETLTNVKAWFYEPDDKGVLVQVGEREARREDIKRV